MPEAGQVSTAHFYFDLRNTNKQGLRDFVPSLLTQLSPRSSSRCDILSDLCLGHDSREKQSSDSVLTKCFKYIFSLPDQRPVSLCIYSFLASYHATCLLASVNMRPSRSDLHFVYIAFDTSRSLVDTTQLMIDQPHSISGKNVTGPTDMMWEFNTSNLTWIHRLGFGVTYKHVCDASNNFNSSVRGSRFPVHNLTCIDRTKGVQNIRTHSHLATARKTVQLSSSHWHGPLQKNRENISGEN